MRVEMGYWLLIRVKFCLMVWAEVVRLISCQSMVLVSVG